MIRNSLVVNACLALIAVALFGSVALVSGRIRESNGRGYDGVVFAKMVEEGLDAGFPNARLRPAVLLFNRAVHLAFGTDVITTFVVTNVLFVFLLALGIGLLMEQYAAPASVRACFVANLAVCVSTSQMYAYYPVQLDLGALALIVLAIYCAIAAPPWLTACAAVAAVASREFGMVVVLFGVHREVRLGRWLRGVLVYTPAVLAFVAIRLYVQATQAPGSTAEGDMLTASGLVQNIVLWADPRYVFFFIYFTITVFGGLSAWLIVQPGRTASLARREQELLSLVVPLLAVTAVGSADIWRYLAFLLPAVAILFAMAVKDARTLAWTLAAVTLFTLATQRPWGEITEDVYFEEWFPYYAWLTGEPVPQRMVITWIWRSGIAVVGLWLLRASVLAQRRAAVPRSYHARL